MVDEVGAFDGDFGGVGSFFFNARDGLLVVFGGQDGVGDGNGLRLNRIRWKRVRNGRFRRG